MKKLTFLLVALLAMICQLNAQRNITPTDSISIIGKVKKARTIKIADLSKFKAIELPKQIIYNHKGEIKDTIKNLEGVPLLSVLEATEYEYSKPKELNEFYFVLKASDDYKVVLSWNEIYNAKSDFFIVTKINGKPIADSQNRMIFISTSDIKPGRRYIKALQSIEVKKID